MTNLRASIDALAATFARDVLAAISKASLTEISSAGGELPVPFKMPKGKAPRGRRSSSEIQKGLEAVLATLKKEKGGLRAEQIREALGFDKRALPRLLREGLQTKVIKRRGAKRGTRYSLA